MNVGYFTIPYISQTDFVDWEWLLEQEAITRGNFFVQVEFQSPLIVRMDGKTGIAVIHKA